MASALACVGLAVSDEDEVQWLVTSAHRAIRETGIFGGVRVGRWQDDSGAALILGWQSGELLDFAPAYTAASGGLLADCRLINESVAFAKVVDADGHQLTAMTFEAEQYRHLLALGHQVSGSARITALGVDVIVYPDADVFAASPGSQLDPSRRIRHRTSAALQRERLALAAPAGRRVLHLLRRVRRPGPGRAACPPVRHRPERRPPCLRAHRAALHRRRGPHRRIRGDLCLAGSDHPEVPVPGNIISGTVVLSAAIDTPLLNGGRHEQPR